MSAIEHEMSDDEYEDFLTDIYGPVDVCGYPYDAEQCFPVLFVCPVCKAEYVDEEDAEECCPHFECELCGKVYDDESTRDDCMMTHHIKEDY